MTLKLSDLISNIPQVRNFKSSSSVLKLEGETNNIIINGEQYKLRLFCFI